MKRKIQLLTPLLCMLLLFCGNQLQAQGPYPNTGNHTVCLNATEPYGVALTAGSTYVWTITPLTGANGTITPGATSNLVSINWTSTGTALLEVTETSAAGCAGDPVSIIVTVLPLPTVTVNSSTICAGTNATVTATPGVAGTYTYAWTVPAGFTNPGNVATFTTGIAGTYSVVITNASGCASASASGTVTINAAPNLVITNPAAACAPNTVDITLPAVTAGSTAGMTFTYWTDAAATIPYTTPTAATAGTYYIKGTLAAGCSAIQPVVVTVNPLPVLVVNNPAAVCAPATADLTAAAVTTGSDAGLVFTYWTDAAATTPYNTPTAATAGTYYIKATNSNGCSVIKPVVVTVNAAPNLVITDPAAICAPATVDLTAAAVTAGSDPGLVFTYWTDAAATTPYATPATATAGTYYIKATNTTTGCTTIKPVVVTVNQPPAPVITGPSPVCVSVNGATSTYSTPNVAGHTNTWTVTGGTITAGQGTNSITVSWTTAGTGVVSVTETITASGCTASVSQNITVNPKPVTSAITHN